MSCKILYTSDLHGNEPFYIRLLKKAEEENANAVVMGGDLCPKHEGTIQDKIIHQKFFLKTFWFRYWDNSGKKTKAREST